jgi:hypothetical protein
MKRIESRSSGWMGSHQVFALQVSFHLDMSRIDRTK